jgi:hypothetical protein
MKKLYDERYVKSSLARREDILRAYAAKRKNIMEKLNNLHDYEMSIIFPGYNLDSLGVQTSKSSDGVFKKIEKLNESQVYDEISNLYSMLNEVEEAETVFHRIFICYDCLATIFPLHYLVIDKTMYRDKVTHSQMAAELRKGQQTIAKMRDNIISVICDLANSELVNDEICDMSLEKLGSIIDEDMIATILKIEYDERTP